MIVKEPVWVAFRGVLGYQSERGNGTQLIGIGYHDDVPLKVVAGYHNSVGT